MKLEVFTFADPGADTLLVQMADEHDLEWMESEISHIRRLCPEEDFCLKAVKVNDWNRDLSPWPADAVFGKETEFVNGCEPVTVKHACYKFASVNSKSGCKTLLRKEGFGDGAGETLQFLLDEVICDAAGREGGSAKRIFLGGYSLAGLFALWAGCRTDRFAGIAAASPSVWFPHFTDYMRDHPVRAGFVYLSLGDREEKTRNPVMAKVGEAIREAEHILTEAGKDCLLEWNKGNHFREPDLRTAKAFAWLIRNAAAMEISGTPLR